MLKRKGGNVKGGQGTRFLLWMDMEGVSQITDYREILPVHHEYWKTGRSKYTEDTVAAAKGLLDGGAAEVVVIDGHGLGWPNLLEERLPQGARAFSHGDAIDGFDGLMLGGFHARCGTPDGFISHTFVPYLRVAIDGSLVTECHVWALRSGLPVIGVFGDEALGGQLDGFLAGTPFAGVKRSSSRSRTLPLHRDASASAKEISNFATHSARKAGEVSPPALRTPFTVSVSMPRDLTGYAEGQAGLKRKGPSSLTSKGTVWQRDGDAAVNAAMGAAVSPIGELLGEFDLTSERGLSSADESKMEEARRYLHAWVNVDSPAWED